MSIATIFGIIIMAVFSIPYLATLSWVARGTATFAEWRHEVSGRPENACFVALGFLFAVAGLFG